MLVTTHALSVRVRSARDGGRISLKVPRKRMSWKGRTLLSTLYQNVLISNLDRLGEGPGEPALLSRRRVLAERLRRGTPQWLNKLVIPLKGE